MKIRFLGGAETVTGSKYLVETGGARMLLDCGLFQGYKTQRERNWAPLGVPVSDIDAVVLSHAHLDHAGWLPVLVKEGFRGPVYASAASRDLAEVLLLDSARLQEEDARRANRGGWSRHHPARPLYDVRLARRAIAMIVPVKPGSSVRVDRIRVDLTPVGHLLGAMALTLSDGSTTLGFSGDLGRDDDLLMPAPRPIARADVLLVESTYGNRVHPREDVQARLGEIVRNTVGRGGSVLLPSFAVGRAQALLLVLQRLRRAGEIPRDVPIILDSPMAEAATALYKRHHALLRIPARETSSLTDGVTVVQTALQSQHVTRSRWPRIIISASGMATGGRVLHHLEALAPDPRNHLAFPGFQVAGTRGARLIAGATEIKVHGAYVPVKAEVSHIEGFSGHADREGILRWLGALRRAPRETFIVHGDPESADALRLRVQDQLGWRVRVPPYGATVDV